MIIAGAINNLIFFKYLFRGEIKDLFEKVTTDELEKSIAVGDVERQELMKSLILALPYHSHEIEAIENLAKLKATTKPPHTEATVPDDLKVLLKNFGVLKNGEDSIGLSPLPLYADKSEIPKTPINSKDYEAFKLISNDKVNVTKDMESFLKQFGLTNNSSKTKGRNHNKHNVTTIDSAYLTENFSDVLKGLGIKIDKSSDGQIEKLKGSSQIDYKNLENVLDTIKKLEKLEKVHVPDSSFTPTNDHVQYSALKKNNVKRQQSSGDKPLLESSLEATDDDPNKTPSTTTQRPVTSPTTTTSKSVVSTTTTTESSSSTTEEAKKNSLEDEIEPIEEIEQLPSPRRSGFYMLVDWNTFLEVGEDPEKIVVRFDPKIGDPSRFLPVNIP
jgi:hypothetical protein